MINTNKTRRSLEVSLSESDFKYLKDVADELNITETELIKKGLKLMLLYAKSKDCKNTRLILENDESRTELRV